MFVYLTSKKQFSFVSNWNFLCSNLRSSPLNLLWCTSKKSLASPHLYPHLIRCSETAIRPPQVQIPQLHFKAKEAQFAQPLLLPHLHQPPGYVVDLLLDVLQLVNVLLALGSPKLDTTLLIQSHKCWTEGKNHSPQPMGFCLANTAWHVKPCLCCRSTTLASVHLLVHRIPWSPSYSAKLFSTQPYPIM